MGYFLPRRWRSREYPRGQVEVDDRHEFADGLEFHTIPALQQSIFACRAVYPYALTPNLTGFTPNDQAIVGRPRGLALDSIQNSSLCYAFPGWGALSNYTLAFLGGTPAAAGSRIAGLVFGDVSGGAYTHTGLYLNYDKDSSVVSGKFALTEYSGGGAVAADSANTAVDGKDHLYAAIRTGSTANVYLDGVIATVGQNNTASTVNLPSTSSIGPGNPNFSGWGPRASIACWAWSRALSADMLRQLNEYPWQMLRPWGATLYFNVTAAATGKPHHYYAQMRA